jgi:hypothetical protein
VPPPRSGPSSPAASGTRATLLRVTRVVTAVLVVVALGWQFRWSTDNSPAFTAGNFFSYFTVQSNILLVVTFVALAARPALADDVAFLTLRGIATIGITVTGLVYAVLLAPTSADVDLTLRWVDFTVHTLAPIVGVADWLIDRPRARPGLPTVLTWLAFPVLWLVYTLIRGAVTDWYPYPFLDPDLESTASIVVTCLGITAVFVVIALGLVWWSGRRRHVAAGAGTS